MYPAVPAKMTENTGEREEKREIRRMERKMNAVLLSVMDFLPNLMTVSKIKTHTQIRMPAKAWITNGFAAKLERNMAIAVMISMEGVMTPKVAARPPENLLFISYKGGYIDSNHAGRALADGKIVHQLFFGTPFFIFRYFPLQDRKHGISSAKSDGAHFKK